MAIFDIGPWVLLVLGVAAILAGVRLTMRDDTTRGVFSTMFFGTLLCGLAIHGLFMLDPYRGKLERLVFSPSPETYATALELVGRSRMPDVDRHLAMAYVLERPVQGLDMLLADALRQATHPTGRRVLAAGVQTLKKRRMVGQALAQAPASSEWLSEERLAEFDASNRFAILEDLLARSDGELGRLGVDRDVLQSLQRTFPRSGAAR